MSLPDAYREQICLLVDSVEGPTVDDIIFAAIAQGSPRRSRRAMAATAVMSAVALVIVAVVVVSGHGSNDHPTRVQPAQTSPVPDSCVVTTTNRDGCDMTPERASTYLGFDAQIPVGIPDGWTTERTRLLIFRDPLPEGEAPLPAGVESVPVYNQIWTPPGTDLNVTGTCPSRVQVRQRPALPGESGGSGPTVDVGDGRTAYGSLADPSTCGGLPTVNTMLYWIDKGVVVNVNADNVDREHILRIVASLQRP